MKPSIENKARLAFALLLAAIAAAAWAWHVLQSERYTTYELRTEDPVSGLIADAPVEFHGVEVGKVRRVELAGRHAASVLIDVRRDVPLTTATVATISARGLASRGFTGYVLVALEDGAADGEPLAPAHGEAFARVRVAPSRSVNVDAAFAQVNDNVRALTVLLQDVLDHRTVAALKASIGNLERVSTTLTTDSERLDAILRRSEQARRRVDPLLASSQNALNAVRTQLLPEADRSLANLTRLSGTLNEAAARVDRDPSTLIRGRGPRPLGPGEER
jgi:phospholipid/cholesterol/gamma-HCH transport system substrate-binding protein